MRAQVDTCERVPAVPPELVVTSDSLVVGMDAVVCRQVIDPWSAVYAKADFAAGLEQVTAATLREVLGSMDLAQTLSGRDQISRRVRGALGAAAQPWGVQVRRVELTSIDRWDRDRRVEPGAR